MGKEGGPVEGPVFVGKEGGPVEGPVFVGSSESAYLDKLTEPMGPWASKRRSGA